MKSLADMEKLIVDKLVYHIKPTIIYLFGSFAKGTMTEERDVDIVYFSKFH